MSVKEPLQTIEKKLTESRQKQADLKSQLAESAERSSKTKVDYENLVKSGADEQKLDAMDAELFKSDRERARIEIRLTQCGDEIEALLYARTEAVAEQERDKYDDDCTAAMVEAAELEAVVQSLVAKASTQRLQRMADYAKRAGVAQVGFKLSNLERRVTAIFHGTSLHKIYLEPYDKILASNIASVERQLGRNAPDEQHQTTAEGTTEAAAN